MAKAFDGYVRVSQVRGREGDSFISPDVQREQIEGYAKARGFAIGEVFVDLDQSGAKASRPEFDKALARAVSGQSAGIIVAKIDRFGRSLTQALDAIRKLDDAGAEFVSVADGIDPTTPAGKMMLRMLLVLAEFELDRVKENWRTARERAVDRGVHIASKTPTGYVRGEDGVLTPHPEFGPVITELFKRRAGGASWRELADMLEAKGVVGPYGNTLWNTKVLWHIATNRVYLGEAFHGEFVNVNAHPPLTDPITFKRVQAAASPPAVRSEGEPALLAGLLRCAGCRYVLKPDSVRLRSGERIRTYRCRGRHAAGECTNRAAITGRIVEPYVVEKFFEMVGDVRVEGSAETLPIEEAARKMLEAEAELAAFRDDSRIVGVLGADAFVDGLAVRQREVDLLRTELAGLQAESPLAGMAAVADLAEMWPELTVPEKQKLLRAKIGCVFLRSGRNVAVSDRSLIFARGSEPADLPRRGHRVPLEPFNW